MIKFNNVVVERQPDGKFCMRTLKRAINYKNPYNGNTYCKHVELADAVSFLKRSRLPLAKELLSLLLATYTETKKPSMQVIKNEFTHARELAIMYGRSEAEATSAAHNYIRNVFGVDILNDWFKYTNALSTETIGSIVGVPKKNIDNILVKLGYQTPSHKPTMKGMPYYCDVDSWVPEIINEFRDLIITI